MKSEIRIVVVEVIKASDKMWYSECVGEKFMCIDFLNIFSFSPFLWFEKVDVKIVNDYNNTNYLIPHLFLNSYC